MKMLALLAFSAALAGSRAFAEVCDAAAAPEGKCKADAGEVRSPVLLQRESLTKTLAYSDMSEDGEEPSLNITGNWFGEEMSGAATITQRGKRVEVVNPHAVWSPAQGVIRGDALHFESPEVLKGEVAELASNKIQIGGHELSRHDAGVVGSQLLERAASRSGLGTGTLDQAIKTKCAFMTDAHGRQPDIRTDSWAFVFAVKPKSHDLKWPIMCSLTDGTPFGKCKKGHHEKHHHCLREGHSVKHWDKEDWGYCRTCPASAVTPKCAFYAASSGEQPAPRTDKWAFVFSKKPKTKNYPVKCSSAAPLGMCEPEEEWDRKNYNALYCLRKEYTKKDPATEDWGYCYDCPKEIINKHVIEEMYKETLYHAYTDQAAKKSKYDPCVGDGDCNDGLACVMRTCREPPLSPWTDEVFKTYNQAELDVYLQKLTIYHGRVMRGTKAVLANYALIDVMVRDYAKKKALIAKTATKLAVVDATATALGMEGDGAKKNKYLQAKRQLEDALKKHKDDFDSLSEKIGDFRALVREQAKQVSARREVVREAMQKVQDGTAGETLKRSNNIADLDAAADDVLRKKKGERGGLIGYQKGDIKRFAEAKTPDGRFAFTIDGEYVLNAGACPEGVCANVGASMSVAVETELWKGDEGRLFTTTKVRVYGQAEAQAGCGPGSGGCKVTLSATAGTSIEQEIKYQHDLGNGVSMDTTAAVEAGLVAKADATAGCTTTSGCRVKAKAFAGAYVKASASQRVGNEDVSAQVGGSVMAGVGAGASADVEANYDGGKISFGGEVCGQVFVGGCAEMQIEVDMSTIEDLADGFVEEVNDLRKAGGKIAHKAAMEAGKGAKATHKFLTETADDLVDKVEDTFKAASDQIDQIGGALEGGYNAVTEELYDQAENLVEKAGSVLAHVVQNPEKPVEVLATVVTTVLPIPTPPSPNILPDSRRRRSNNVIDRAIGWLR